MVHTGESAGDIPPPDLAGRAESNSDRSISRVHDSGLTTQQMAQLDFASKKAIMGDYTAAMDESIRAARQPYAAPAPSRHLT